MAWRCGWRGRAAFGALAALGLAMPSTGRAQGVLPAAGTDIRLGNLRQQFERAFQTQPPASTPGWTFTPAVDLTLNWTDRVPGATARSAKSDFFATVSPSLAIQGDGARVTASVFVAPLFRRYLETRSQDSTAINFNGQSHVTLLPEVMFLDLRGAAATQSYSGGFAPNGTVNLGRQDQVQTTTFSASPYLQHRFGGFGLGEIGYSMARTTIERPTGATPSPFFAPLNNQSTLTTTLHAGFTSGENFGRTNFGAQLLRTDNGGTGAMAGSHRYTESATLGYAVTRSVLVAVSLGHEDIRYSGVTPYVVNGLTWNASVRLTPNPDSSITVGYGLHDGQTSASLDATYAPTARIRLTAQYSDGLTTGQEQMQQALSAADFDATGQAVDHRTGVPLSLSDNFFGTQTTPARMRRMSATATLLRDRDVFSLDLRRDETRFVVSVVGSPPPNSSYSGLSGGVSWQHEFSAALRGNTSLRYGTRDGSGKTAASQQTISASLGMSYRFTETLSGQAQYSYYSSFGATGAVLSYKQNLITVGVHKSF